jgi:hypothetical protein
MVAQMTLRFCVLFTYRIGKFSKHIFTVINNVVREQKKILYQNIKITTNLCIYRGHQTFHFWLLPSLNTNWTHSLHYDGDYQKNNRRQLKYIAERCKSHGLGHGRFWVCHNIIKCGKETIQREVRITFLSTSRNCRLQTSSTSHNFFVHTREMYWSLFSVS